MIPSRSRRLIRASETRDRESTRFPKPVRERHLNLYYVLLGLYFPRQIGSLTRIWRYQLPRWLGGSLTIEGLTSLEEVIRIGSGNGNYAR
jgi:hypothetical protein